MAKSEVKITLDRGPRESYYRLRCSCGWGDSVRNSSIHAREVVDGMKRDHLYCHEHGVAFLSIRAKSGWETPPAEHDLPCQICADAGR